MTKEKKITEPKNKVRPKPNVGTTPPTKKPHNASGKKKK